LRKSLTTSDITGRKNHTLLWIFCRNHWQNEQNAHSKDATGVSLLASVDGIALPLMPIALHAPCKKVTAQNMPKQERQNR
jgi:hypothetical protein